MINNIKNLKKDMENEEMRVKNGKIPNRLFKLKGELMAFKTIIIFILIVILTVIKILVK